MNNFKNQLSKEEIISRGYEFDGDRICYSGEYGQQVCDVSSGLDVPITGMLYEFYANGNINYYCMYENGIPNGENISFYEDGSLMEQCMMYKGVQHGKMISWFNNGAKKAESESKYGFNLYYKEWNENGDLIKNISEPTDFGKRMIAKYEMLENRLKNEKN